MNIPSETTGLPDTGAHHFRTVPIPWPDRLNSIVGMLAEVPAAILVVAEVVVLLMGVIWRYVLHHPLVWSDELASILFLWLAMLGSVVALRRGEHMRMTAIVGMLPHNKLGRQIQKKLRVYAGPEHPHTAQQPTAYDIKQVSQ